MVAESAEPLGEVRRLAALIVDDEQAAGGRSGGQAVGHERLRDGGAGTASSNL
jgi:hypothetical protein